MKLKPIGEWVVIEPLKEEVTPGGIILQTR